MMRPKEQSCKTTLQIVCTTILCIVTMTGYAHGSDSTSRFMVELSTRSLKIGHEIGNNDIYLSIRSTNRMLFEDYLYTRGDTVIYAVENYTSAAGTIAVGLGYDAYWHPSNFDLGIRAEIAYSKPYVSYQSNYRNTFGIINDLNFIVNKRFDRFSVGAAAGPETTWDFGHWISLENPNGRIDKKNHIISTDLSIEVFARVYL